MRIEAPGRRYLRELGREVALGDVLSEEEKQGVARLMAKSLREVIEGAPNRPWRASSSR